MARASHYFPDASPTPHRRLTWQTLGDMLPSLAKHFVTKQRMRLLPVYVASICSHPGAPTAATSCLVCGASGLGAGGVRNCC